MILQAVANDLPSISPMPASMESFSHLLHLVTAQPADSHDIKFTIDIGWW